MIKLVSMLKRRPGLTMEQFVSYYEDKHVKLGEQKLKGKAARYVRRYLYAIPYLGDFAKDELAADFPENLPAVPTGGATEADFDVITEIWFANIDQWQSTLAVLNDPAAKQSISEDEAQFIDRSRRRHYIVVDRESDVS